MDGWNTFSFPFGAFRPIFRGKHGKLAVRFREGDRNEGPTLHFQSSWSCSSLRSIEVIEFEISIVRKNMRQWPMGFLGFRRFLPTKLPLSQAWGGSRNSWHSTDFDGFFLEHQIHGHPSIRQLFEDDVLVLEVGALLVLWRVCLQFYTAFFGSKSLPFLKLT